MVNESTSLNVNSTIHNAPAHSDCMAWTHWLVATSAPTRPASQASGKNVSQVKPGGSNAGTAPGDIPGANVGRWRAV